MRILITGGTGALARDIVASVAARDARDAAAHPITLRLTSRHEPPAANATAGSITATEWIGADLATGLGLLDALKGVDAIIHTASDSRRSLNVDVEGTRHLVVAARQAGVRHLVFISIVGIDQIPLPYYMHKLAAERIIETGRVPFSILRATQFHSLIDARLRTASRFPLVMPLPVRYRFQTVDTREVAGRLLDVALQEPAQRVPDMGGPDVMSFGDMARSWCDITGVRKTVLPLPFLGRVASAFRAGKNTTPNGLRGTFTWQQWLARRYRS